jgi:prefoldin subunit 5
VLSFFQNPNRGENMHKDFYYRLDIVLNAITRKGKELAKTEEKVQEWLKDYLVMLTEIEKYAMDLKDIWEEPKADEALQKLEQMRDINNLKELEEAIKNLRDELAEVYNRYLEEVMNKRKK